MRRTRPNGRGCARRDHDAALGWFVRALGDFTLTAQLQQPPRPSEDSAPGSATTPTPIVTPGRRPPGSDSLDEGVRAEMAGDLDRAAASFTAAANGGDPGVAAEALTRLADVHRSRGQWESALTFARRGRETAHRAGLEALVPHAMIAEANALMCRGDFTDARVLFEQVLVLTGDARMRGLALQNLGSIMAQQGELGAAERYFA